MNVCVWVPEARRTVCGAYEALDPWTLRGYRDLGKLREDRDDLAVNCLVCMSDERRRAVLLGVDSRVVHYFERQIRELRRAIAAHQHEIEDAGPIKVRRGYAAVAERKHRADRRLWSLAASSESREAAATPSKDRSDAC